MSGGRWNNFCERVEHVKLSKKVLYHFAKFAGHELLIIEDRRISAYAPRSGAHHCRLWTTPRGLRNGVEAAGLTRASACLAGEIVSCRTR